MKKRYLLFTLLIGLFTIMMCPKVFADDNFVELTGLTNGGNAVEIDNPYLVEDGIISYYLNQSSDFGFTLKGYDLTAMSYSYNIITPGGYSMSSIPGATLTSAAGYVFDFQEEPNAYNQYYPR